VRIDADVLCLSVHCTPFPSYPVVIDMDMAVGDVMAIAALTLLNRIFLPAFQPL